MTVVILSLLEEILDYWLTERVISHSTSITFCMVKVSCFKLIDQRYMTTSGALLGCTFQISNFIFRMKELVILAAFCLSVVCAGPWLDGHYNNHQLYGNFQHNLTLNNNSLKVMLIYMIINTVF